MCPDGAPDGASVATLDDLALSAYQSLQAGDWQGALVHIDDALLTPGLMDRPALAARLQAWAAQCWLLGAEPGQARRRLSKALAINRAEGDAEGLKALAPIQAQVMAAMTAKARPAEAPSTLAGQAVAAMDQGDPVEGERLAKAAQQAAQAAGDAREEVLAWLALARLPKHRRGAIEAAAKVADASNDFNLVTAVAHAARAAGVLLAAKVF